MRVHQVMTTPVLTIQRRDSLAKGARLLHEQGGGCLAVVDGTGKVIGALTEAGVCRAVGFIASPPMETPVSVGMSTAVPALQPDTTLDEAHERMRRARSRHAVVADAEGRPAGLVTLDDLGRHAVQDLLCQCSTYRAEQVVRTLAETKPSIPPGVPPRAVA